MASPTGNAAEFLAAHWTEQAVYATWAAVAVGGLSLVVSIFAVLLVRQQLKLNRKAIQDASRSAIAASNAADAARAASRPWLQVIVDRSAQYWDEEIERGKLVLSISGKNVGALPAANVSVNAIVYDPASSDFDDFLTHTPMHAVMGETVFPGETSMSVGVNIDVNKALANHFQVATIVHYQIPGTSQECRTVLFGIVNVAAVVSSFGGRNATFYPTFYKSGAVLVT